MKKIVVVLLAAVMTASLLLTACGESKSAPDSGSQAGYSFDVALDYLDNNTAYPDEVHVALDGKDILTVKKSELGHTLELVDSGSHTITVYGADKKDVINEATQNVTKKCSLKITIDNNKVSSQITDS